MLILWIIFGRKNIYNGNIVVILEFFVWMIMILIVIIYVWNVRKGVGNGFYES